MKRRLRMRKLATRVMATLALAAGVAALSPTNPAYADSWIGTCNQSLLYWGEGGALNGVWGWCDGNGPNWQYYAYVYCSDYSMHYGDWHWAGDRTGSLVLCPPGEYAMGPVAIGTARLP